MVKQTLIDTDDGFYVPDANQLVTEDDTPIGNFASEKQQRLFMNYEERAIFKLQKPG